MSVDEEPKKSGIVWEQIITVTSKGQVTLPKDMRDSLNICDGSKLMAVLNEDDDCIILKPMLKTSDLEGSLRTVITTVPAESEND